MSYKEARPPLSSIWPLNEPDGGSPVPEESRGARPSPAPSVPSGGRNVGLSSSLSGGPASVRYSDRPMPLGTRMFGLGGTGLVCLAIVGAALFKWAGPPQIIAPTTLTVFDVAPPEAPPAPDTEIPPGPEQVQKEDKPKVEIVETPPPPLVQIPSTNSVSSPPQQADPAPDPGPPVDQTTAPQSSPKPPGSRNSDAKPTWEGQMLAALNAAKRYPLEAKRNRQQGMPWIRFTIDREGRVRSVRLERPSGFDALDREALALPMRASPLPKPPESVTGNRIELTVPIEFFLS